MRISENRYEQLLDSSTGLCRKCGAERGCCEPDARNYPCDNCEENEVFGAEELFMMGELELE